MKKDAKNWKCVGCGKPAPNRISSCDCPTGLLHNNGDDEIVPKRATAYELKQEIYAVLSVYIDDFSPAEIASTLREMADEEMKRSN